MVSASDVFQFNYLFSPTLVSSVTAVSMGNYSESTRAMLCLVRIETDPADRTQLRMTVGSGDPTLTYEYICILNPDVYV